MEKRSFDAEETVYLEVDLRAVFLHAISMLGFPASGSSVTLASPNRKKKRLLYLRRTYGSLMLTEEIARRYAATAGTPG